MRFALLTLGLVVGCAHGGAAPQPLRSLSPDSLALLHEALRHVRPAFATQEEAVRAGVYHQSLEALAIHVNSEAAHFGQPASQAAGDGYIIQIAAYRDRAVADRAAAEAQRRFPQRVAVVEAAGEVYRVGLAGWESTTAATAALPEIQRAYPGAWVRRRGVS
ncbi:MAG TPA: SPOR domain-containing protein [Allosphingosinicella sp.]|nr:SPOR domain-containing protein [Allosphingosinicella sp.]